MRRLGTTVRHLLAEARECLAAAASPAEIRSFVERFIGPLGLTADGHITRPKSSLETRAAPEKSRTALKLLVAGAGFEPAAFEL